MTAAAWALAAVLAAPLAAQSPAIELLERKTLAAVGRFDEGFDGVLGVAAIDLSTGRSFAWHGDTAFPQASVIKIAILAAMFRARKEGTLRLDEAIALGPGDAVGGSGRLAAELKKGPLKLTWLELAEAMMKVSDNSATNKLIDRLGMDYVNRAAEAAGAKHTRLSRRMMDAAAVARGEENLSTPNDMARLMEAVYRGRAEGGGEMIAIMKGLKAGIAEGVPPEVETASKTGSVPGVRGETGVVFLPGRPFVVSVMATFIDDRNNPVPEATRIVYRHFEKLVGANPYGNRLR